MEQGKTHRALGVLAVLGFIATITLNTLANALPLNGMNTGQLSDAIPNLFVPAGITFAIWGPIYLLLTVFTAYLAFQARKEAPSVDAVGRVGIWYFISCIANSLWIVAWHWQRIIISFVIMLLLLASLVVMYVRTRSDDASLSYRVAVMLPLSVYLGWITVATIANLTAVFVTVGWSGFGLTEVFWTVAVMIAAIVINLLVIILQGDIWFSLVGVWALYGIYLKRSAETASPTPAIVLTALVGMALIVFTIVVHLVIKGRRIAKEGT